MARHSFQPRNSLFPCFSRYFPKLRALLREISPIIFPALPFSHRVKVFPIRLFPLFILCSTFLFPLISFPPLIHPALHLLPPLSFSFLPTFPPLSPINNANCARPHALRTYAYAPTYPHIRRFSFIAFTSSPTSRNPLYTNALGVKKNEKKPSQNTQPSQNQDLTTNVRFHPL